MNPSRKHVRDGTGRAARPFRGAPHRSVGAAVVVALATAASCAGTETDNPDASGLVDFRDTGCKSHAATDGTPSSSVDAGTTSTSQPLALASDYDGLQCVAWELGGDATLRLRFINFNEGCGVEWKGRVAHRADGTLDLEVVNDHCAVAGCGWCIYDWDFEVADVEGSAPLALSLTAVMDGPMCAYQAGAHLETQLPIDSEPDGVVCGWAHRYALEQMAAQSGVCGAPRMPCSDSGLCDPSAPACAAGLTCSPADDGSSRCLEPCTSDADCQPAETLVCRDGLCQLDASPVLPPWQEPQ